MTKQETEREIELLKTLLAQHLARIENVERSLHALANRSQSLLEPEPGEELPGAPPSVEHKGRAADRY